MEKIRLKNAVASELINSPEKRTALPADIAVAALILLNISLILLDLYSHPHQGLADPERRKILELVIGDLAKYIGNYGFSSCLATAAVFAKHSFDLITQFKKEISPKFLMRLVALISVLNVAIESFTPNNQFTGDVSLGFAGAIGGTLSAALLIRRAKARKKEKSIAEKPI